jgi:hypothetical protein
LAQDAGWVRSTLAPLVRAHEVEALGYLHMSLRQPLGTRLASTVKILA